MRHRDEPRARPVPARLAQTLARLRAVRLIGLRRSEEVLLAARGSRKQKIMKGRSREAAPFCVSTGLCHLGSVSQTFMVHSTNVRPLQAS